MSKHLSKQEAEEALEHVKSRLETLELQWPLTEVDIDILTKKLAERREALEEIKKEVDERRTEIANLRNTLGAYQQTELVEAKGDEDFAGCPHEWQRQTIVFMRKQPGVQIHFGALLTNVNKNPPHEVFTKARSAMLNLMGHLITQGKVAKGKNGNYAWAVYPKDWKVPTPVLRIAPATKGHAVTSEEKRELIAERLLTEILSGKEWLQKGQEGLEPHFHKLCAEQGISMFDIARTSDALFIEAYMYRRAQPDGILNVYEKDPKNRKGNEVSQHMIISKSRHAQPQPPEWVLVPMPTVKQESIGTKRRGGAVPS